MIRFLALFTLVATLLVISSARAQTFTANLELVDGSRHESTTSQKPQATPQTVAKRTQFEVKAGVKMQIRWKVTCVSKDSFKDVLVHFYVVPIAKAGQASPPLDPKVVKMESAQTMDFTNGVSTSAELGFYPDEPGVYLVQIEVPDQQMSAAMDLTVK
ncbi:MAG TPA: hypothetical protein VFW23_07135 [Tepidisphaeraceae bacterium]|nr:hypothetical protein [Tepidisphaeraceae bacterium]